MQESQKQESWKSGSRTIHWAYMVKIYSTGKGRDRKGLVEWVGGFSDTHASLTSKEKQENGLKLLGNASS